MTLSCTTNTVLPEARGQGMGGKVLEAYKQKAKESGLSQVIAPARPVDKSKFPDLSMEKYANLFDENTGEHVDPWIRTHLRHGGKIVKVGKNSHVVHSSDGSWPSVEQWQEWTGKQFPKDGLYDIPNGNAKLNIHDGIGEYSEDCIWIVYDV